jgi:hypothetical protein
MNKYLVLVLVSLGLVSCSDKKEQYYRSHPKELQQALKSCPADTPPAMTCDALQQLGGRLNELAYQLQSSPQGFGAKILSLQETIATQEAELKESKTAPDVKPSLIKNKSDLADYLAVVKWLESPES